jgi:hypothetical protein
MSQPATPPAETPREIYKRVMRPPRDLDLDSGTARFAVRGWDGMGGCWTDCHDATAVTADAALAKWLKVTDNGTRRVAFSEIDYYRIFPADTRMTWDGSDGREMFR